MHSERSVCANPGKHFWQRREWLLKPSSVAQAVSLLLLVLVLLLIWGHACGKKHSANLLVILHVRLTPGASSASVIFHQPDIGKTCSQTTLPVQLPPFGQRSHSHMAILACVLLRYSSLLQSLALT
jgi:hypothetical protein